MSNQNRVSKSKAAASGRSGVRYSDAFKADAVRLVTHEHYSIAQAAAAVGVSSKSLRDWHLHATKSASVADGAGDGDSLQAKCRRLREQLRRAEMERDILKKAAIFFANDTPGDGEVGGGDDDCPRVGVAGWVRKPAECRQCPPQDSNLEPAD